MMGFRDAAASAGPYANSLHLAPDKYPHQHLICDPAAVNADTEGEQSLTSSYSAY